MRYRLPIFTFFAVVSCYAATVAPLHAAERESQPTFDVKHEMKTPVPMRDGTNLAAEIYRPDAPGKFPALMVLRYFRSGQQNQRGPTDVDKTSPGI